MRASTKLATYATGLVAVFGVSAVVGGVVEPTGLANAEPAAEHSGMSADRRGVPARR
jgi:hypothetical protein